ncbi:MAG: hypothetical protein ACLUIQ_10420 [Dialister invisus]
MEKAANPFLYVAEEVMMKKCSCLLWLLMAVCFAVRQARKQAFTFIMGYGWGRVCYALEVTTEDGEVLYADDSVWQNEVIFPADISSEAEEKIFWRVRPFDLYAGLSMAGPKESLLMRPAVFWNGKRLFSVRIITRTGG